MYPVKSHTTTHVCCQCHVNASLADSQIEEVGPVFTKTAAAVAQQNNMTAGPAQAAIPQPLARAVHLVANSSFCNDSPHTRDLPLGAQLAIAICQTANALQRECPVPSLTQQMKTSAPASRTAPMLTHSATNAQLVKFHPSPAVQQPVPAADTSDGVTAQISSGPEHSPHSITLAASLGSSFIQQQSQKHTPALRLDSSDPDGACVQVSSLQQ